MNNFWIWSIIWGLTTLGASLTGMPDPIFITAFLACIMFHVGGMVVEELKK